MKLDGAIFAIEPRSVGACLDLAIVFLRKHAWGTAQLLALFALPSVALTWWLITYSDWTLYGTMLLFVLECPFFGTALVIAAGNRMFGDEFSPWLGVRQMLRRLPLFATLMVIVRCITWLAMFFFVFPAYLVSTRYGFLSEILYLEASRAGKYESRLNDLMSGSFGNLLGRLVGLMLFYVLSVLALFLLVDLTSDQLFDLPVFIGRISGNFDSEDEIMTLLSRDPRVAVVLMSLCWLVYPVTRLAWMLCYLDLRIRKEGWDVELDFRVEARRLEQAA